MHVYVCMYVPSSFSSLTSGKMWKDHDMLPQLEALSEHIDILSLQITELNDVQSLYYLALVRAH
jgi:hypothetical protein